jgi:hypothetical protein
MKVGDIVFCIKDYTFTDGKISVITNKKKSYYKITKIYFYKKQLEDHAVKLEDHLVSLNEHPEDKREILISVSCDTEKIFNIKSICQTEVEFEQYFITLKKLRKLKLEKING